MPGRVRSPAERPLVRRQDLWCRHHGAAARGPAADLRLMAVRTAGTDAHLVPPLGVVKYLVAQHTAVIWARSGIGARPCSSAWSSTALVYGSISAACSEPVAIRAATVSRAAESSDRITRCSATTGL